MLLVLSAGTVDDLISKLRSLFVELRRGRVEGTLGYWQFSLAPKYQAVSDKGYP